MWKPIEDAEKGKYVTRKNPQGVEYQMFDHIRIIGGNEKWVGETYWIPGKPKGWTPGEPEGRWNMFAIADQPTKYQSLPVFPAPD